MDSDRDAAALRRQLADPLLAATHPVYRPLLWTLLGCVLLFIGWAAWAQLDEVTRGDGRVVPFSRIQKIQSLEGGILDRLLVKEGDLVEVGQPLVRLDETRFLTNFQESANQASVLRAAIARLDAEVLGKKSIEFPPDVDPEGPLARSERELFKSRRDKLVEGTQAIQRQIHLAQSQLDLVRPLVAKRAVSQMEALKLSQDIATLSGKLTELKSTYFQDAYTERAQRKADLSALEPIVQQRQDQLRRTEILSPVRGRVNTVLINTRGGVIQPGEPIMEVIPVEERLLVEAKIKPRDVAFLVPGMPAKVKITAYDYTIYGDLKGTLEQISADTIEEDTP
ncbi:HlyD family efflux transporter periplasmic adaptor subunit, partial [Pseudomonas aeruginosa]